MRTSVSWRWGIPAFAVLLVATVASVFLGGWWGARSAASAARLPIPSSQTVHLDERTYMVSFAAPDSRGTGLHVPADLRVAIVRTGTGTGTGSGSGKAVDLRRPTKRFVSAGNGEDLVDQYEIDVPEAGDYHVAVAAGEDTDGHLLIGDRPINGLRRVFLGWMLVTVIGTLVAVALGLRTLARRGGIRASVEVRTVGRRR